MDRAAPVVHCLGVLSRGAGLCRATLVRRAAPSAPTVLPFHPVCAAHGRQRHASARQRCGAQPEHPKGNMAGKLINKLKYWQ